MKIFWILFLLVFVACSGDDDFDADVYNHCVSNVQVLLGYPECSSILSNRVDNDCDIVELEKLCLSDKTKSYLGLYCKSVGDILQYVNIENDTIQFVVTFKNYQTVRNYQRTEEKCHPDSAAYVYLCFERESLSVGLYSRELYKEFVVRSKTIPQTNNSTLVKMADEIAIAINTNSTACAYTNIFRVITNQRTFHSDSMRNTKFYPKLSMGGRDYDNVVSMNSAISDYDYNFYFDQDNGIIGFKNRDGKSYSLIE